MGELLALQWRDIDYVGEAIRVRRSYNVHGGVGSPKSGKVRGVPMVPDVASALARLAEQPGPFIDWRATAVDALTRALGIALRRPMGRVPRRRRRHRGDAQIAERGPGRACRIRFLPMQSRSTPTALTLAHGRPEADYANERDVAKSITPAPRSW
jgi:integrase